VKWCTEPGKGGGGESADHLMPQEGGQTEEIQVEESLEPGLFFKNLVGMVSGYSGPAKILKAFCLDSQYQKALILSANQNLDTILYPI